MFMLMLSIIVVIFIMSQATTTTTKPSVTVECAGALSTMTTVVVASTAVGLPTWQDELPPLPLILTYTIRGVASFAVVLEQQLPSQMGL